MSFKLEWRIPATLLCFAVGFVAVTALRWNSFPWIQPGPTVLDRLESGEFNTVFLGDSRVYMGVSPDEIDRAAGHGVRSCIRGGTALRMNRRYLDCVSRLVDRGRIRIVVAGLTGGEFSSYGFSEERDYVLTGNKSLWRRIDDSPVWTPIEKSEFKNLLSRHAKAGGREYRHTNGWWAFEPYTSKRDLSHNMSYYKTVFTKGPFQE
ncbi:MAG: hypothetical protein PHI35_08410 [Victivallaceae bacterium]|nr:hypothetical protein [Victivallaceae bacterium]